MKVEKCPECGMTDIRLLKKNLGDIDCTTIICAYCGLLIKEEKVHVGCGGKVIDDDKLANSKNTCIKFEYGLCS